MVNFYYKWMIINTSEQNIYVINYIKKYFLEGNGRMLHKAERIIFVKDLEK